MAHTARKNDIVNAYRALRGFDAARFATEYLLISPSFFCNILARRSPIPDGAAEDVLQDALTNPFLLAAYTIQAGERKNCWEIDYDRADRVDLSTWVRRDMTPSTPGLLAVVSSDSLHAFMRRWNFKNKHIARLTEESPSNVSEWQYPTFERGINQAKVRPIVEFSGDPWEVKGAPNPRTIPDGMVYKRFRLRKKDIDALTPEWGHWGLLDYDQDILSAVGRARKHATVFAEIAAATYALAAWRNGVGARETYIALRRKAEDTLTKLNVSVDFSPLTPPRRATLGNDEAISLIEGLDFEEARTMARHLGIADVQLLLDDWEAAPQHLIDNAKVFLQALVKARANPLEDCYTKEEKEREMRAWRQRYNGVTKVSPITG